MAVKKFSVEDGNVSSRTIVVTRTRDYSDIDLTFSKKGSGDVYKKIDAAAVKQSVKNIILTNYYEKPFNPFFGTSLRELLFELHDLGLENQVDLRVKTAIQTFEPRAKVEEVRTQWNEDQNFLDITIIFRVVNTNELITLNTTVSRLR